MSIVGAFDIHRRQITFEYQDDRTGELKRGRIMDADRQRLRRWLASELGGSPASFALEGCTGWRYVSEELSAAGIEVHLADPAEVQGKRGPKKRAKTDRSDCRLLRELLVKGELPESWIPPTHVLEVRAQVRLYKALLDTRARWQQRMQAVVFHHGLASVEMLADPSVRATLLAGEGLSPAGQRQIATGYALMDAVNTELVPLSHDLARISRRQAGCRALRETHFGVGPLTSVAIWAEMGDCRRFVNSAQAVRHTGLDITVRSSDDKRRGGGYLSRQGPGALRWALYEAARCASRTKSPDHDYYLSVRQRYDASRANLAVARKLARRCYHTLSALGDVALEPIS